MAGPDLRDAPRILNEVLHQVTSLAQSEIRLARAELSQNLSKASAGFVLYSAALVLGIVALNTLAGAVVAWLQTRGFSAAEAAGASGLGLLALAVVCALLARRRVNAKVLTPQRSLNNLRRDMETLQEARRG
ncbi:phage holin family protein [Mameliella alba]|nr:phage holin family protein [Mameliella alba]MBY6170845.1 phage holin family protein [Mameliella alba]MBY6175858.1 phage holin family protein [Mameliella alba]